VNVHQVSVSPLFCKKGITHSRLILQETQEGGSKFNVVHFPWSYITYIKFNAISCASFCYLLINARHAKNEIPENGQQLRPKHVGTVINKLKTAVQQVGVKFYVWKMTPLYILQMHWEVRFCLPILVILGDGVVIFVLRARRGPLVEWFAAHCSD